MNSIFSVHGTDACQYRDLEVCVHETQLVWGPDHRPVDTKPRCLQRKVLSGYILGCFERNYNIKINQDRIQRFSYIVLQ